MSIFSLDTNFVIPRILHNGSVKPNQLDRMIFLQKKDLLEICLPKSTQAEIYAVLRAGRYPIRVNDQKVYHQFSHADIMKKVHRYRMLFDTQFLNNFKEIDFGKGKEYKPVLFENMKYILGMDIEQSIEFVQNRGILIEAYKDKDPYDFHIMVATLKGNADYLVTQNTSDFPNPLGRCKIITSEELPHYLPIFP